MCISLRNRLGNRWLPVRLVLVLMLAVLLLAAGCFSDRSSSSSSTSSGGGSSSGGGGSSGSSGSHPSPVVETPRLPVTNAGMPPGMDYDLVYDAGSQCYELTFSSDHGFEGGVPTVKQFCESGGDFGSPEAPWKIDIRPTADLQECPFGGIEYRHVPVKSDGSVDDDSPTFICAGPPPLPEPEDDDSGYGGDDGNGGDSGDGNGGNGGDGGDSGGSNGSNGGDAGSGGDTGELTVECRTEEIVAGDVLSKFICEALDNDDQFVHTLLSYYSFNPIPELAQESVTCEFTVDESPIGDDMAIRYSYLLYEGAHDTDYKFLRLSVNAGDEWPLLFSKGPESDPNDLFFEQSVAFLPGMKSDGELEGYFAGRIFTATVDLDGEAAGMHEVFQLVFFDMDAMGGESGMHPDSEDVDGVEIDPSAGSGVIQLAVHPAFEAIGSVPSVCERTEK